MSFNVSTKLRPIEVLRVSTTRLSDQQLPGLVFSLAPVDSLLRNLACSARFAHAPLS